MPKVLQINITSNWGSTGKIAESINLAAERRGWECSTAYGRWAKTSKFPVYKVGNKWDMYVHYFENRIFDREGLSSRKATKALIRHIEELKPDVINLHNIHDHYLNYQLLFEYLNETDIKVVWTLHDFWAVTGHCMHFISQNCHLYEIECHDCPMQKVFPRTVLDRSRKNFKLKKRLFSANKNLTLVPVSEWVGQMAKKSFLRDKAIRVINNGIDLNVFNPTPMEMLESSSYSQYLEAIEGKFVIMAVASQWAFDKGLEDYKQISEIMAEDEVIVLVGVIDENITNLPNNIIGIKRTTIVQELAALYTRADVITILSSAETFGLTVVEGYACGTPAVVYDNTAPPLLITPETGFVAENRNYMSAYDYIQQIKAKGKKHYSEACIKLAYEKYDKNKNYKQYVELYNELLK